MEVRWEREDKNSGTSLENAIIIAWKEKKVTESRRRLSQRKEKLEKKNCNALTTFLNWMYYSFKMHNDYSDDDHSFAGNSTTKNT